MSKHTELLIYTSHSKRDAILMSTAMYITSDSGVDFLQDIPGKHNFHYILTATELQVFALVHATVNTPLIHLSSYELTCARTHTCVNVIAA